MAEEEGLFSSSSTSHPPSLGLFPSPFIGHAPPPSPERLTLETHQGRAMLTLKRRSMSASAIVVGSAASSTAARAGGGKRPRAGTATAGGGGRALFVSVKEEVVASRRKRERGGQGEQEQVGPVAVMEEELGAEDERAARILATGMSPRVELAGAAHRGAEGVLDEAQVAFETEEGQLSPEDEARRLLTEYTFASPSPLRKRTRVRAAVHPSSGDTMIPSPLRFGSSAEGSLQHVARPSLPISTQSEPLVPLRFPSAPTSLAPAFTSPKRASAQHAQPLSLSQRSTSPPSRPQSPIRLTLSSSSCSSDPRGSLSGAPAAPSPPAPKPKPKSKSSLLPTPARTPPTRTKRAHLLGLPPGHPQPLNAPPSATLLPNLETLLASWHLLPAGSVALLEELVEEGMAHLDGVRRGESDVVLRVRKEREAERAAWLREERQAEVVERAVVGPRRERARLPSSEVPMQNGVRLTWVHETGLEKDELMERREGRKAAQAANEGMGK